jgi:hypothetical protein
VQAHARRDTYFFKATNHTAFLTFQTNVRGSEANLSGFGIRSIFEKVSRFG